MHAMTLVVLFGRETRIVKEKERFGVIAKTPRSGIKGYNIRSLYPEKKKAQR